MSELAAIRLFWLPLGAGGSPVVRVSGRLYERLAARRGHRRPCALYHCALEVRLDGATYTLEMAPEWSYAEAGRGVVATGSVGSRALGRLRWFRYEVRCWLDGVIPDRRYAVAEVDVPTDPARTARLLALAPAVPTLVWGRDELGLGEMWNSNSLVSWVLDGSGHDLAGIAPPVGGRAPGWDAGLALAGAGVADTSSGNRVS